MFLKSQTAIWCEEFLMKTPSIAFSQNELLQFEKAIQNEWLITNGLGGYASSTVLGLNTRKYHGLLVAALRPPGERTVVLSKLDEDVKVGEKTYQLGANDFRHDIYPRGYKLLQSFSVSPFPKYTFSADNVEVKKTVFLPFEKNATVAFYEITNRSSEDATIQIYPLLSYRHFHYSINRKQNAVWLNQSQTDTAVEIVFNNPAATVILKAIGGRFAPKSIWVEDLFYREEEKRGEASMDEGYQPGYFDFQIPKNSETKFAITAAVSDTREEAAKTLDSFGSNASDIGNLLGEELNRRTKSLLEFSNINRLPEENDGLNWLMQSANDFVVKGNENKRFVIAGYQWFGSWGRDSFVSLPGLMLANPRFEDARGVILDYTNYCKLGLIPNLIDDKTGEPLYNTVDGTLWYINSILQFLKYTGGFEFVKKFLWPTLVDIVQNHKQGTINNIHVDSDGLLAHGPQLTWMDTIVDDAPFTPRSGKAVEVQALWYNALGTMKLLAEKFGEPHIAEEYSNMATNAKNSFNLKFWDKERNCLFDVITDSGAPDSSIRPNQVIVGALDFSIIDSERANRVVDFVQAELLTPVGLRTLSPKDSRYKGRYEGDRPSRDRAYHNGSIWAWLTGPLTTAFLKAKGYQESNIQYALNNFIVPLFTSEIRRGGLGTLNEINDGDPPYTPRGCIAQAWSVAEPLRAYIEDVLKIRPKYEREILPGAVVIH
jgi:predicted glycogen debranching enzyme